MNSHTLCVAQGTVYDRVIQEVCEASRVDFEEGGVDQQTLEEMRMVSIFFFSFSLVFYFALCLQRCYIRAKLCVILPSVVAGLGWQKRGEETGWSRGDCRFLSHFIPAPDPCAARLAQPTSLANHTPHCSHHHRHALL